MFRQQKIWISEIYSKTNARKYTNVNTKSKSSIFGEIRDNPWKFVDSGNTAIKSQEDTKRENGRWCKDPFTIRFFECQNLTNANLSQQEFSIEIFSQSESSMTIRLAEVNIS